MQEIIHLPSSVEKILRILKINGYKAYAVGGCIRDAILGRQPKDWDITTNALPAETKELFEKTVDTGLKHGTVTVLLDGDAVEVTTFRVDGCYEDGRHPSHVEFTGCLEDDLCRRDFTMNAMAWNAEEGMVDPFGGREDIAARRIRSVGEPGERFREDALRMLRAVRFATRLGFEIDKATYGAICENKNLISNVSSERIREELNGMLTSDDPMKLALLRDVGLLELILPEVEVCFNTPQHNPHHVYSVGEHSFRAVAAVGNDKCLRWAMLLHDTGKAVTCITDERGIDHFYGHPAKSREIAKDILTRLKFDKRSIERITRLIKFHDREIIPNPKAVAKAVHVVGEDLFLDLLKVKRGDIAAQNPMDMKKGLDAVDGIEKIYRTLQLEQSCLKLKDLAIDGEDLMQIGFVEGRAVGRVLQLLFEKVLEDQTLNEKKVLTQLAAELLAEEGNLLLPGDMTC